MTWEYETYQGSRIGFEVKRKLFEHQSEYQLIEVFESTQFGNILRLDGAWMVAEKLEKTYHEMIVHPALSVAPSIRRVLVIGGGDGGTVREVLKYSEVMQVEMVEIDRQVVRACKEHLSSIGPDWSDPRLLVSYCDGVKFIEAVVQPYDVIIIDGSDPVGPAAGLFNHQFYSACSKALKHDGILVTQGSSPRSMLRNHIDTIACIEKSFVNVHPYYQGQMLYPGGVWSWIMASQSANHLAIKHQRLQKIIASLDIYNPFVHRSSFAQPPYVRRAR